MITSHSDGSWRIWLGIANKQVDPDKYQGSYLELHADGSVQQWTGDEGFEVMEKRE